MGKRFKNSEEAIKALKKQGWISEKGKKHGKMCHPLYKGKLTIPRKHRYLSDKVEGVILKAVQEIKERKKG